MQRRPPGLVSKSVQCLPGLSWFNFVQYEFTVAG